MSRHEARAVEVALAKLAARFDVEPRLHAERLRAQREFFGPVDGGDESLPGDAAGQRFLEWLLLERESEVLGAVPVEVPAFAAEGRDLGDSVIGVFVVLPQDDAPNEDGVAVEAQDLQDDTVYDLSVPPQSLQSGDLLVGRLFDAGSDQWRPSSAAAVFRPGTALAEAFRRDIERLALQRRLRQIELEHLLLRRPGQTPSPTAAPPDAVPLEHLEADLEALLAAGGGKQSASDISGRLQVSERPGPVMGPLLEELAFETEVDLDAVRELLLRIWNAHHGERPHTAAAAPPAAPAGESLGEQLVRTLDEGLRRKRDVEDLFAQLERMAGIEGDDEDDGLLGQPRRDGDDEEPDEEPDDGNGARYDPAAADRGGNLDGDLEPLVQEYLWETGREQAASAEVLRQWIALQQNAAVPRTDLEQVTGHDLLRLLVHRYLGADPAQRAAVVRGAFDELQGFYAWAARTQELDLQAVLQECRQPFVDQVERFAAAGRGLSSPAGARSRPAILAVEELGPRGFGVRDDEGEHHWLEVPAATLEQLRVGDLVLGALEAVPGRVALAGLVVVLPGAVRGLME